ncbi:MAG: PQQ-binding-like beta-propeller repeat protein [Gammaproteobacteria bacterium]|nr:PQQ-binding-like beta-propeller repeat protein [Gammaproteobacteria bacterium]
MIIPHRKVFAVVLPLLFATQVSATPVITGVNEDTIARSGRVAITGTGFGAEGPQSEVLIAGLPALASTWTDTRIVAYVPEAADLGATSLWVDAQGMRSNEIGLTVTDRQATGRVRWTFEAEGSNLWWRPALAPDGTIYVHAHNADGGLIYALSQDGALLWIGKAGWSPYVPPSAGPDGAVYVGSISTIYRISPQGSIDWQYRPLDGFNIRVAPTIGPNGLLYGAFELSGVFAMEPLTGTVIWSNPGNPAMTDKASDAVEMKFGPSGPGQPVDQIYASMEGQRSFYAFSSSGDQLFTASLANSRGSAEAAIGSDGTIYGPSSLGLTVKAIDPTDGSTLWQYYPGDWATGTLNVEIGPDDTLYFVGSSAKLEAYDPHSQYRKWQFFDPGYSLGRPSVTPDGATLILAGSDTSIYGYPGFVKAFASRNGRELWTVNLPFQLNPGYRVYGVHHPRITPDGTTAYVSTLTLAEWPLNQDPHSFVYAIDISSAKGGGKGGGGKGGGKGGKGGK